MADRQVGRTELENVVDGVPSRLSSLQSCRTPWIGSCCNNMFRAREKLGRRLPVEPLERNISGAWGIQLIYASTSRTRRRSATTEGSA